MRYIVDKLTSEMMGYPREDGALTVREEFPCGVAKYGGLDDWECACEVCLDHYELSATPATHLKARKELRKA